jgi:predicted metal-dependent hydrolase
MMESQGLLFSPGEWAGLGRFFFGQRGLFFRLWRPYLSYFEPGFHPSQLDCSALLQRWRADFARLPRYQGYVRAAPRGAAA